MASVATMGGATERYGANGTESGSVESHEAANVKTVSRQTPWYR